MITVSHVHPIDTQGGICTVLEMENNVKKEKKKLFMGSLVCFKKTNFFYGIRSLCDWMKETRDVDPGSGRQDMTKVSGLCCRKLFLFFSQLNPKSRSARRAGIQIVNYFVYYVQIGG